MEKKSLTKRPVFFGKKSGNIVVILIALMNTLVTLAVGFFLYKNAQKEKNAALLTELSDAAHPEEPEPKKKKEGEHEGGEKEGKKKAVDYGHILNLDTFTINLSTIGPSNPKYLRVSISLEVATAETENEVNARLPLVRDAVIDLFNGKRTSDLVTSEQRDIIKDEIKNYINSKLVNGKIKSVYFTSFSVTG